MTAESMQDGAYNRVPLRTGNAGPLLAGSIRVPVSTGCGDALRAFPGSRFGRMLRAKAKILDSRSNTNGKNFMDKSIIESLCGKEAEERLRRENIPAEFAREHVKTVRMLVEGADEILTRKLPEGRAEPMDVIRLQEALIFSQVIATGHPLFEFRDIDLLMPEYSKALEVVSSLWEKCTADPNNAIKATAEEIGPLADYLDRLFRFAASVSESDPSFVLKASTFLVKREDLKRKGDDVNGEVMAMIRTGELRRMMALPVDGFLSELLDKQREVEADNELPISVNAELCAGAAAQWFGDVNHVMFLPWFTYGISSDEFNRVQEALCYSMILASGLPGLSERERNKRLREYDRAFEYYLDIASHGETDEDGEVFYKATEKEEKLIRKVILKALGSALMAGADNPEFPVRAFMVLLWLSTLPRMGEAGDGGGLFAAPLERIVELLAMPIKQLEKEIDLAGILGPEDNDKAESDYAEEPEDDDYEYDDESDGKDDAKGGATLN